MKKISEIMKKNVVGLCIILGILLIVSIIMCVSIGPVSIPFVDVWKVMLNKMFDIGEVASIPVNTQSIVWFLRAPRVLLAAMVGIFLTLSGIGMQAFTKNPLADPYVLGISSGASSGAVLAMITGALGFLGQYSTALGAFAGAIFAILLVYSLSKSGKDVSPIKLILIGVAVSAIFGAFTNFLVYKAPNDAQVREVTFWMLGGFAGVKWEYLVPGAIILIPSIFIMFALSSSMNAMLMGESTAINLGVNISLVRKILIFTTAIMTAISVAVSGCIGFVGLVIPHIVRAIVGADHKKLIPVATLCGAIFMMWVDVGARMFDAPGEMPIGIITSLLGAPFFLWMVKFKKYSFGNKS